MEDSISSSRRNSKSPSIIVASSSVSIPTSPIEDSDQNMSNRWRLLVACGFNANSQVTQNPGSSTAHGQEMVNVCTLTHKSVILLAKWAYTIVGSIGGAGKMWFLCLTNDTKFDDRGLAISNKSVPSVPQSHLSRPKSDSWSFFGSDFEPLGALNPGGSLYCYDPKSPKGFTKLARSKHHAWLNTVNRIKYVAVADSGQTAILVSRRQSISSKNSFQRLMMVFQFPSFSALTQWYTLDEKIETKSDLAENNTNPPSIWYHTLDASDIDGLVAGATAFVAWSHRKIWTWGLDSHSAELGRDLTLDATSANRPALVTYLEGLQCSIEKVEAQGSTYVALTSDGDLYMWGTSRTVKTYDNGVEVENFQLMDVAPGGEVVNIVSFGPGIEHDVIDVALGFAHMVVITVAGRMHAIGDNRFHQLPYVPSKGDPSIVREWIDCKRDAVSVWAGPMTTFFAEI